MSLHDAKQVMIVLASLGCKIQHLTRPRSETAEVKSGSQHQVCILKGEVSLLA